MKYIRKFKTFEQYQDLGDIDPYNEENWDDEKTKEMEERINSPEYMEMLLKNGHISQDEFTFWAMETGYWE